MLFDQTDNAKMYLQKAIPYIRTEILFGSSVSHKPIKNWEIENVKVGFLKLSLPTIFLRYQNMI